jgi:hypothetical protein
MRVRKTTVAPEYATAIENMLSHQQPLEYILDDPRLISTNILKGETYINRDYLTFGHLPRRIIVAMVDTDAYNGRGDKNPYNFQHFKVSKVSLSKNGLEYPTPPIVTNFENGNYVEAYRHFMSSLHADSSPFVPSITLKDFAHGYTLFSWDMSPDQYGSDDPHMIVNRNANIKLSVEFAEPLKQAVTLIVYYQLDMRLTINQSRQVTVESI